MAAEQSATSHRESQKTVENTGLEQFGERTRSDHLFHFAETSTVFRFFESDKSKPFEDMMIRSLYPQLQAKRQLQGTEIGKGIKRLSSSEELAYIQQVKDFILNNPQHGNLLAEATPQIQSEMQTLLTSSATLDEFVTYLYSGLIFREAAILYKKYYSSQGPLSQLSLKELFWIGYEGLAKALQKASTSPQQVRFSGYAYKWIKGRLQDYIFSRFEEKSELSLDMPLGEHEDSISLKDIIPAESGNPEDKYETNNLLTNFRQVVAFFPPDSQEYQILTYFSSGKSNFVDLKRDIFPNESVARLAAFWHWRVIPEVQMLYGLFTNPARLTRKQFSELMQSSDSLQEYLTNSFDETSPLKQILQQHELLFPQQQRITTAISLLDTMSHLSLADKFAFLVLQEQQAHRKQMKFSDNIRSDIHVAELFGLSPDLVGVMRTQIETTQNERFERFTRWVDKIVHIKQTRPDIQDPQKIYSEFHHWLYEILTDPTNERLQWKELGNFMPVLFRKTGELPDNRTNRMWRNAIELEKNGLIEPKFVDRTVLKRTSYYNAIAEYSQRPENTNRRITFPELGKLLGIDRSATVQEIVADMKQAGLPVSPNIGERQGPRQEMEEKIRVAQEVIDELVDQNMGKTPPNEVIQEALNNIGRSDIDINILTTGRYKKYLTFPERRKKITETDREMVRNYGVNGKTVREIAEITGFSETIIRKILAQSNS